MRPEDAVNTFIDMYLLTEDDDSEIENKRNIIRDNQPINSLLFNNRAGLNYIFNEIKSSKMMGVSLDKCN